MADRLAKNEFEKLWRRWLPLCSEPVESKAGTLYPSFGHNDSELTAAFAMLIQILRDEYGYTEDDMESACKITLDFLCPHLATQTSKQNSGWKNARKNKFDRAMEQIFGFDQKLADKYKAKDFKKNVRVQETAPQKAESVPLPYNQPIWEVPGGFENEPGFEIETVDILRELGVKK